MKTVFESQSVALAQGARVALEAEGIRCQMLNEFDRGTGLMPNVPARVVVFNDDDVERAQAIIVRLAPPRTPPPPSWRWQKRGLLILGADVLLAAFWLAQLDRYESEGADPGIFFYAWGAVVGILFIIGMLFIILGPRADRAAKGAGNP